MPSASLGALLSEEDCVARQVQGSLRASGDGFSPAVRGRASPGPYVNRIGLLLNRMSEERVPGDIHGIHHLTGEVTTTMTQSRERVALISGPGRTDIIVEERKRCVQATLHLFREGLTLSAPKLPVCSKKKVWMEQGPSEVGSAQNRH